MNSRQGAPEAPDVSVVIINYERPEMTMRCVAAAARAISQSAATAETIVVDNGSRDGSVSILKREASWATLVRLSANGALPAALNSGWRAATGRWVLMLNNDVLLEDRALAEALLVAERGPEVGMVALEMRFAARPGVINSAGISVDRLGVPFDLGIGHPAAVGGSDPTEVFGACGAAALYRRTMLASLGGFDESFGFGFEDVDLSWRAQMDGWRSFVAPSAVALHAHGGTVPTGSRFRLYQAGLNRVRLLAKHAPSRLLVRYGAAMVLYDAAYVGYVMARQRTVAPFTGRLRGVLEWRSYRRAGRTDRRAVELAPVQGVRAALRRRSAWSSSANRSSRR